MYLFKLILSCFYSPDIIRSFFDPILSDYQILSDNQVWAIAIHIGFQISIGIIMHNEMYVLRDADGW